MKHFKKILIAVVLLVVAFAATAATIAGGNHTYAFSPSHPGTVQTQTKSDQSWVSFSSGSSTVYSFTFASVPAGNVTIDVDTYLKPTVAGSNCTLYLTDIYANHLDVRTVGLHSTEDADYVLNKFTVRHLEGYVPNWPGGTLSFKLRGDTEGYGQTFLVGTGTADQRWWTSAKVTVN